MIEGIRVGDIQDGYALAESSGAAFNPVVDTVIARVTPGGKRLGGVVYTNFTGLGGSVCMHVAGFERGWVNRTLLWAAFSYPFDQLRCKKVFGQVPAADNKLVAFNEHLGFKVEHVILDVYPDGHMFLLSMTREECRFLKLAPLNHRKDA